MEKPVSSYVITAENTCDMPNEYYDRHDVSCGRLSFTICGKNYRDFDDEMNIVEFYRQIRLGEMPVTSMMNVEEAQQLLEPILARGSDVLHIGFSSALSGTYNSFVMAAEELREKYKNRKVIIIDSLQASMGQGLLLDYVLKNKNSGMNIEKNAAWAEENKLKIAAWFTVDDLNHLYRGGRLSKTGAIVGSVLGIKPVLFVNDEGKLQPSAKARGQRAAFLKMIEKMRQLGVEIENQQIFLSHSDAPESAEAFAEMLSSSLGVSKANVTTGYIGPIIGAHTGPGTVAVFFFAQKRE
jgi:DegV family protein with EDD domain